MKSIITVLFIILSSFSIAGNAEPTKKVLIIVSNKLDMGDVEKHDARNNLWEVAPPYHILDRKSVV